MHDTPFQTITTQGDIDTLMTAYHHFHDACIVKQWYESGDFVDANGAMHFGETVLHLLFHSQLVKQGIVLCFHGVQSCHLIPRHDAMFGAYLRLTNEDIFWADGESIDPQSGIYVMAKSLQWQWHSPTFALELTQAEAVVLSDLLWRNTENQQSITLSNATERQVLWNVECLLEKQLPPDADEAIGI